MSLETEASRVIQGTKDTLKVLINKLGGTIADEKVDQYPTLADAITSDFLKASGGKMTGSLTLSGAPTADLQASTKKYVDDSIITAIQNTWEASY